MEEKKQKTLGESLNRFGRVSRKSNRLITCFLGLITLLSVIPFFLVVIISFTDSETIQKTGYRFIPDKWSLEAYRLIFEDGAVFKSFGTTLFVTIAGTIIGVFLMSTFAYTLSRKNYAYRGFLSKYSIVPMLFSGGIIGNYIVIVNILGLRNSIWSLILPLCMSTFSIMILRTFYQMSVPEALIESAYMDGASEWTIYFKIILPLSLPGLATIALFLTLGYWNDWFSALLYIDSNKIVPLQYLLMKMETNIEFIANNAGKMGMTASNSLPTETIKMAVVVLSTAPILIAYPFFQKYFIGGLTVGAVKE
ncbi:carbohydrate ABC transporter permease [Vagococcus sp. BWB3-3]|uniref:Carbohydrate ABC transporter permease n=1 Tax=Vagococcus allomyrinae TaxID=2794353 RepID=A0A940P7U2_9ENTE|nr:carbohydrate ABC transporter permease [Vagococcus allomyrinae]MBP1039670.1 carbohydrate ABC transporter permease [Vagococcus allomyrinae]